ncbi:hypothetical protein NPIL_11091 [Nephila pilipes]|uniref:Uncharacterized protein n=1 Tax=Nephila pilipes TaxID=299642 RepID=A0A8X6PJ61_NEPPI|nr:hypothetical protein NPIL_11091 [Nephila pilipes]
MAHEDLLCACSGANYSIAGETLYLLLQRKGANFKKTRLSRSLADGHKSEVDVFTRNVDIRLKGNIIRTPLIALPYAKGNRTLLGTDFFTKSWHFFLNLKHCN